MRISSVVILAFLFAAFVDSPISQPTSAQRSPIIDVHVHAYARDERWAFKAPNPRTGKPLTATSEQAHMQASFTEMKKYNIVKAIVSNHYDAVKRWKAVEPERILVSYGFDDPATADLAFLRREHAAGTLFALGEVGLQYEGIAPNDPKMEPIWNLAEELDLPVGLHTGLAPPRTPYTCCPKFRNSLGNPALLEEVLVRHPKLRVYLMHAGFPFMQETIAIMHMYPQVYADLGVLDWSRPREEFHEYLRTLIRSGFGKRLMFGSDQMIWPEAIGMAVEGIDSATFLTEEQKRDIFYNNAVRFFRLDEKTFTRSQGN